MVKLLHAALSVDQQSRIFGLIAATFQKAINARSPKMRPPGKAGLRAEKGYYRLLYVEGDFHEKVNSRDNLDPDTSIYKWDFMATILHQLTDIPELHAEILSGIETALDEITGNVSVDN